MKKASFFVLLLLFMCGCTASNSGYSKLPYAYSGISSHWKRTNGTSNLVSDYEEPPTLLSNGKDEKQLFEIEALRYLEGVKNDLKDIKQKAENASEKIDAVKDAIDNGFDMFYIRNVGSPTITILFGESNFGLYSDYPEFPAFNYYPPSKPTKPLFLDNKFAVDSYNIEVDSYNRKLADFVATIEAYIEDAKHYYKNCQNDYKEIEQKGKNFRTYIKSLTGMDDLVAP
jgi:hypothetical protein